MLERDYYLNYSLTKESQQSLYRKAENDRLAKNLSAENQSKVFGTLGVAVVILIFILFM